MYESHIVRIYRRNDNKPEEVAGLVESVSGEQMLPFKNYEGLVSIMRELIYKGESRNTVTPILKDGKGAKKSNVV